MNGIVKPLQVLICCDENARFSLLLIFKNGFTIKRAERPTGNCSRSLIFKMNLWKGVLCSLVVWNPDSPQIAALNVVLKSSNNGQNQKTTFSVKLTRIP